MNCLPSAVGLTKSLVTKPQEMVFSNLRNIKPLVLEAYQTNNNLSHEERKSLSKLAKLSEERKIAI